VRNRVSDSDLCLFRRDPNRDQSVVEEVHNIVGMEVTRLCKAYIRSRSALSPARLNPTVKGEATAVYPSKLLKPLGVK
jgi:recombinational DNA repair protein RecR